MYAKIVIFAHKKAKTSGTLMKPFFLFMFTARFVFVQYLLCLALIRTWAKSSRHIK